MSISKSKPLPPLDVQQRYNVDEACRYLRTSRMSIYKLVQDEKLTLIREGGRSYVSGSEIARLSRPPATPQPRSRRGQHRRVEPAAAPSALDLRIDARPRASD